MTLQSSKKILFLILCVFFSVLGYAQDGKLGWQVELKKIALDFTSTEVRHADRYSEFSDARLTSDSQTAVRGHLHQIADFHARHYLWTNSLLLDYGKTKIRPVDDKSYSNENADKILLTTGYTQRLWQVEDVLGGFEVGPFADLAFETEFTEPKDSPRKKVVRSTGGIKLFEGKYIKNLFAAVVGERDYTYRPASTKLGWEIGINVEQPIREGVSAKYAFLFRDYLSSSSSRITDIDYELAMDIRLDVELYKNLYLSPFINYYTAQAKYFGPRGENIYIGFSLSFSHVFASAN